MSNYIKEKNMNAGERARILEKKHQNLHQRVEALEAERAPEQFISKLKKEKLALRDEIVELWRQVETTKESYS
jgi:uncharacterized protein YdcH (DUF465 family)